MTRPKNLPRKCVNGHDLNVPENWVERLNVNGVPYRRCKPCLETSGQAERRRRSLEWHAQKNEDKDGVRQSAGIPDPRSDWRNEALCADEWVDSEVFFSEWGEEEAVKICRKCPVQIDCLAAHLYEKWGIFGGTTPNKREALRRNGRRNLTRKIRNTRK